MARVELSAPTGMCVGLVAKDLNFPRGLLSLAPSRLIVLEMGGWEPGRGRISLLSLEGRAWVRNVLFDRLDRPNGIAAGPDKKVYVSTATDIVRFNPAAASPALETVLDSPSVLARTGTGRHPLKSLAFDSANNLLIGVGSATDHCELGRPLGVKLPAECAEAETQDPALARGVILLVQMQWPEGKAGEVEIYARGLRNPLAIAIHPGDGSILAGDSAHDISPADYNPGVEPADEINLVKRRGHYGWPYCFESEGAMEQNPDFANRDCTGYRQSLIRLPPHATPLALGFWSQSAAALGDTGLLVALHGYRERGHRIVLFRMGARGLPSGEAQDIVSGWERTTNYRYGGPSGIAVAADGSIFFSDDHRGRVMRVERESGVQPP